MIDREHELPVKRQAELLLNRAGFAGGWFV